MVLLCWQRNSNDQHQKKKKEKRKKKKNQKKIHIIIVHHPTTNRTRDFLLTLKYTSILSKTGAHHMPQVLASLLTLGCYIL
jgi:hypothetical protein